MARGHWEAEGAGAGMTAHRNFAEFKDFLAIPREQGGDDALAYQGYRRLRPPLATPMPPA
jgi:hypothetical protein